MLQTPAAPTATAPRRLAAVVVWSLAWGLVAAATVLWLVGGAVPDPGFPVHREFFLPDAVIAAIYGPVSAVVLARSRHRSGWILATVAVGFGLSAFGISYALFGAGREVPLYAFGVQLVTWGWVAGAFAGVLVLPWILDHRPAHGARLAAAVGGIALTVFACVTRMLLQVEGGPPNPVAPTPAVSRWAYDVDAWIIPVYFAYGLAGAVFLLVRHRRADADDRRGLGWVIASVFLVTVSYICFETGLSVGGPLLDLAAVALFAAQIMLPAAIFVLVLREPQGGVDVAVSRATMWGLLTAAVVAAYVGLIWLADRVLPIGDDVSGVVAAAGIALAVVPAREWVQRRVDRLVYGSASDAELLLSRLGADVSGEVAGRPSLQGLVDGLRRSLRLRYVGVASAPGAGTVAVVAGDRTSTPHPVALVSRGRRVGVLEVAARPGERLDPRTLRLLDQVAGLVAVALELAQVNDDLERARSRLVDVRQEERRLLRRELHDGLGPALAGVSLALAAIANNAPSLSERDAALLGRLQDELNRRAEDVRDMARTLLPPALDDGRLHDALGVLAERFSDTRFVVRLELHGADALDTRRQVAVYHVAAEAVFNAYRHAGAGRCVVELTTDGEATRLAVTDDGSGLPDPMTEGIGMTSMRERAHELGGTFSATHGPRGTRVEVVLP